MRVRLGMTIAAATVVAALLHAEAQAQACSFTTVGDTMYLNADCVTTDSIVIPDAMALDCGGNTITGTENSAGDWVGGVVESGGSYAEVRQCTVEVSGLANACKGGDDRLRGILFDGASGVIEDNSVLNINKGASGCQEGNGIEVRNAPYDGTHPATVEVEISDNTVIDYQKTGIVANGDVSVDVTDNVVVSDPSIEIASNGIQLGYGASGTVKRNSVDSNWYEGASWTASGILAFETDHVTIQRNHLIENQTGIAIETWCWFAPSASNNQIVRNTVENSKFGITVQAIAWDGYSGCDPESVNNKVTNNEVINLDFEGEVGIYLAGYDGSASFDPLMWNNKIVRNQIGGFAEDLFEDADDSKVQANVFAPEE